MLKLIKKINDYLFSNSYKNIDNSINVLREKVEECNKITEDILLLESTISKIEDDMLRYHLKLQLYDHLNYLNLKEVIDTAW